MSGVFFYTIGIGFASGVFARSFFDGGVATILFVLLLSATYFLVWRLKQTSHRSVLFIASLALFSLALGMARVEYAERQTSPLAGVVGSEVALQGVVVREPDIRERSQHLYVRESETDALMLVFADRFEQVSYGDVLSIEGTLEEPEAFETDLGRTFNYPGYLKARGVTHLIPYASIEVLGENRGNQVLTYLFRGKQYFIDALERALPEPAAGLGEGLLLGVKRALGEDLEDSFRTTGIIHIVVLSGYNVMIIVEAVMLLLSFAFFPRTRVIIGAFVIISFAFLVGISATVARASTMAVLLLVARATGRIYAVTRALMLAGVAMLLINPYLLAFDPGFTLSFLATLGLILLSPKIEERLGRVPSTFGIREFMTATIATQLFVLPFLLYQMGTLSVVSILVNVLVLPMVPVAMLLTFLTGLASLVVPFIGMLVGFLAHLSLQYIIVIAEFFARLPFASFSVPVFPFWVVIVCYVLMGVFLSLFTQREMEFEKDEDTLPEYDDWTIEVLHERSSEAKPIVEKQMDRFPFR